MFQHFNKHKTNIKTNIFNELSVGQHVEVVEDVVQLDVHHLQVKILF